MSNNIQPDNVKPSQITPSPTPFSTESQPGGNASTFSSTNPGSPGTDDATKATPPSPMDLAAAQAAAAKKKADDAQGGTLADPGNKEKFIENFAMGVAFQMAQQLKAAEKKQEDRLKGKT